MAYSLTAKPGIAAGALMWDKAKDAHFCLCLHKDFATHETLWMLDKTKSTFLFQQKFLLVLLRVRS